MEMPTRSSGLVSPNCGDVPFLHLCNDNEEMDIEIDEQDQDSCLDEKEQS